MADNLVFRLKRGESGAVLTATLKSEGSPVNLTTENIVTVHVAAKRNGGAAVLDQQCTIESATGGIVSYAFTSVTSDIPVGDYLLEFRAVDNGGDEHYFPKGDTQETNYGILRVTNPLS
jgi:hypothetical protein